MALVNIVNMVRDTTHTLEKESRTLPLLHSVPSLTPPRSTLSLSLSLLGWQVVLDNPCNFANPFQFEITFECLQELEEGMCPPTTATTSKQTRMDNPKRESWSRFPFVSNRLVVLFSTPRLCRKTIKQTHTHVHTHTPPDLEWKVIYVGSAHDTTRDQVLDEILVGPVPVGVNKFVLQAEAPTAAALPPDEIVGVTVVLVTCSYRACEFVRVGYYVNNEYLGDNDNGNDEQQQQQQPPPSFPALDLDKVQRQILADKPRVTKFPISWGAVQLPPPPSTLAGMDENTQQQQQQDVASTRNNNDDNDNALEQKMAAAMTTTTTTMSSTAATSGGAMETD